MRKEGFWAEDFGACLRCGKKQEFASDEFKQTQICADCWKPEDNEPGDPWVAYEQGGNE